MNRNKRAFTLIELLVVIAIIAILAAILFPVFAQAKDAAKDVSALSNVKQMGTSMLMYTNDYDDAFALHGRNDLNDNWDVWQGMIQPYAKNWDIVTHPKLTRPSGSLAYWQRLQHWGVLPRAASVDGASATNGYFEWNGGVYTGNAVARFDGVFGAGVAPSASWYAALNAPSMTQSSVQNISDMVMISEAGNWDMWFAIDADSTFGWCWNWGGGGWTAQNNELSGPHARKRSSVPIANDCWWPAGQTTYVATDGSAKAVDWQGRLLERRNFGGVNWIYRLQPHNQ